MDFSQRLLQESLRTNLKIHLSFSPFYQSCSRLSDSGKSAKVWKMRKGWGQREGRAKRGAGREKRKKEVSSRFFFLFALSQFYGPDYLGAWFHMRQQSGNSCPRKTGIQWIVLHDAAPAFPISCPVHCTAKLAELEGSEALGVRVKKGRIYGTVYFCQSNKVGKLHISRFSINRRGKLDLEFWYQSWNRRTLGISLGHGTCCAWLVVWYDFCSCWILTPWMPTYGSNNLPSYQ